MSLYVWKENRVWKNIILSILLCISCLTGCQETESENGKTNQQQIALKDIVAENAGKIEETNSQVTYIGKSESQEDIDLDEKDINLDDDSDSIQK